MRKQFILSLPLAVTVLLGAVKVAAQEMSMITVTGFELNNRVLIVDVAKAGKTYKLQCNQGMSLCTPLTKGKYLMIELPKNYGLYDCKNVEVFPESATGSEEEKKLGEYCLIAKDGRG